MSIFGLEDAATVDELRRIGGRNPDFEKFLIAERKHWRIYLHENQCCLGRSYAWWSGTGHVDLMAPDDLTREELNELVFDIGSKFRNAVKHLWGSTHVNYAWLGNETKAHRGHGHLHMIPRYFDKTPVFHGLGFPDPNIGKNYAPHEPLKLPLHIYQRILEEIRSGLEV